jgi:2-keto-4-pentenoate hydratase
VQAQLNIDRPVFGQIFHTELYPSGVTLEAALFDGLAIEGEFAIRLARDIPSSNWLQTNWNGAVGTGFAVIELHNYVFRRERPSAAELIGNNAIHAGAVMPVGEPAINIADLDREPISVCLNDRVIGSSSGSALPGGPAASLSALADHLAGFGDFLRAGQIVLTGSPLPLYRVACGDRIHVECTRNTVTASVS